MKAALVAAVIGAGGAAQAQGVAPGADDVAAAEINYTRGVFKFGAAVPAANRPLAKCLSSYLGGGKAGVRNNCSVPIIVSMQIGELQMMSGCKLLVTLNKVRVEPGSGWERAVSTMGYNACVPSLDHVALAVASHRPGKASDAQRALMRASGSGAFILGDGGWFVEQKIAGASVTDVCRMHFLLGATTRTYGPVPAGRGNFYDVDWSKVATVYLSNNIVSMKYKGEGLVSPTHDLTFAAAADAVAAMQAVETLVRVCTKGH